MKKRIAILISGQPRMLDYCAPKFSQLFNNLGDIDYFVQSYNEISIKAFSSANPAVKDVKILQEEEIIQKYKKLLNPKSIVVNNYDKILKIKEDIDNVINNILKDNKSKKYEYIGCESKYAYLCFMSQIYGTFLANEEKKAFEEKNNFKYDTVIKIRSDIILKASFQYESGIYFNNLISNIPKKGGAINPICVTHMHTKSGRFEVGDFIMWGQSESFDSYLSKITTFYYKLALENLTKYINNSLANSKQLTMSRIQDNSLPSPEAYWARLGLERGISFFPQSLLVTLARPGVKKEDDFNTIHNKAAKYLQEIEKVKSDDEINSWVKNKTE